MINNKNKIWAQTITYHLGEAGSIHKKVVMFIKQAMRSVGSCSWLYMCWVRQWQWEMLVCVFYEHSYFPASLCVNSHCAFGALSVIHGEGPLHSTLSTADTLSSEERPGPEARSEQRRKESELRLSKGPLISQTRCQGYRKHILIPFPAGDRDSERGKASSCLCDTPWARWMINMMVFMAFIFSVIIRFYSPLILGNIFTSHFSFHCQSEPGIFAHERMCQGGGGWGFHLWPEFWRWGQQISGGWQGQGLHETKQISQKMRQKVLRSGLWW